MTASTAQRAPQRAGTPLRFSDDEIEQANARLDLAFDHLGLATPLTCPECGTTTRDKVKFRRSRTSGQPYWKCFRCGAHGSAVSLLTTHARLGFVEAVNLLLERTSGPTGPVPRRRPPVVRIDPEFTAEVDAAVYNAVVTSPWASPQAAQQYYGAWHISADAVAEAGAVVITDAAALASWLTDQFGRDRLVACGLVKPGTDGRADRWLLNADYPVIEPHKGPSGNVVGMQFRPAGAAKDRVDAHKAYKRFAAWAAWQAHQQWLAEGHVGPSPVAEAGWAAQAEQARYVPPFLSLRGAGPQSLVGCGLHRLGQLHSPARVYVVEGFKDLLAARTLGAEAYAIPGTGVMPSEQVLTLMRRRGHTLVVCLDGDAAGAKGRAALMAHLAAAGIPAQEKTDMPPGMDVTDILVDRHASNGCDCGTCQSWRRTHPQRFAAG